MTPPPDGPTAPATTDPLELLRTRGYVALLLFGALIGVPVAAVAYGFLRLVDVTQEWLFATLPDQLGFSSAPWWWPVPLLAIAGVVVAVAITYLPGTGGHEPSAGLVAMGSPSGPELAGVVVAAFVTLAAGVVLGPEAPLIAIGGGLAALAVRTVKHDAPAQASVVIGAAGSFAAISTLLGSPIVGAFLLMEVAGLAGPMVGVVLAPGLLAAGVGSLVFLGLNNITGWGTFSLGIPELPPFQDIQAEQFLWAIAIGLIGAALGTVIRRGATWATPRVAGARMVITPLLGVAVALCAVVFDALTDRGIEQVLFSGETTLAPLIQQADSWTVGALALLILCKSVAYLLSLSAFRGGPTFPAMFIGAALGVALSHLPGLPVVAGVAMGIGALAVTMLRLPLTSVLLTVLFLQSDGLALTPLVIVAVVVAYVASVRFTPASAAVPAPTT